MARDVIITEARDLRTGRSLWLAGTGIAVASRASVPKGAEIVIVGAGISGAMMAYALRDHGAGVVVLDRREPLRGSTAASTALLQFEIDTPLIELTESIGRDRAERAWRRSLRAVERLREIVREERIRCGWRDSQSLYLAGDASGHRALAREAEAREAAGIPGVYLRASELAANFGIKRTGAILSEGSAQANPMQVAAGLFRRAGRMGVRVCSPVTITDAQSTRSGVRLILDDGEEISARAAVFCTGYEVLKPVPEDGHSMKSTWAFASAPNAVCPPWLDTHLLWEASDPYLYVRRTRDGRIVAGGEDESFSGKHADPELLRRKTDRIAAKLRKLLPGLDFRIAYRWAGVFGESSTGLPLIDRVPGLPHCWVAMGYGGNGITYSLIAAEIIAKWIEGKTDPDGDLYRLRE